MAVILTRPVHIAGEVRRPGSDVAKIATAGEIASLVSQGFARRTRGKSSADDPPPADPPEPPADTDPPAEDPQSDPPPADDSPAPDEDFDDQPVEYLGLDAGTTAELEAAGLAFVSDVRAYLAEHGKFNAIHGIGNATDRKIKAALA